MKRFIEGKQIVNLTEKLKSGEKQGFDQNGMEIPLSAEADYVLNQCAMLTQHCENYFRWLIEQGKQISRGDVYRNDGAPDNDVSAEQDNDNDVFDGGDFLDEDSDEETKEPSVKEKLGGSGVGSPEGTWESWVRTRRLPGSL